MTSENHPCRDNLLALQQGVDLIRSLDDALFSKPTGPSSSSGIGSQFRHCLDFYNCFLQGLPAKRIDYDARKRDARSEIDREHAAQQIERVIDALASLTSEQFEGVLHVKLERPVGAVEEDWCASSAKRELQFLLSHTVHHHALIVTLLRLHGHELGPDQAEFGVSPSTLSHWRKTGTLTG
jgi:uncharacterized damage-inducible protein DinB